MFQIDRVPDCLTGPERELREKVNNTHALFQEQCIHQGFFITAQRNPELEALLWDENGSIRTMTYGELADKALRLAAFFLEKGIKPGEAVAVSIPRGPNQVIAVLAVLAAGAAYVPIGIAQPVGRRERIYRIGGITRLVTDAFGRAMLPPEEKIKVILMDEAEPAAVLPCPVSADADALAYVIFTSGSTGEPKGVEITHRAAYNTIFDINRRFSVNTSDRILAVSALDFDLSVYDLFGLFTAGGSIVLLNEGAEREAAVWLELIRRLKVTVWNSVPALLDMLLIAASGYKMLDSLRLALVSGDWVGLDLPERLMSKTRNCRFIALGGATEASIWSNFFEVKSVDPSWNSIPYGKPLSNQYFRVVDQNGCDCPDMVTGELWIGGAGVARGYRGNYELTAKSFVCSEDKRWYCTGDLGRYWPDGNIEFIGRADQQVKLRGYRVELGEIEAVLRQYSGISQAVAVVSSEAGTQHLAAAVVASPVLLQIQAASPIYEKTTSGLLRNASRELQGKFAEALIVEILCLAELENEAAVEESNLVQKLGITDETQPVLRMWLRWLDERKVLTEKNGVLRAGARMREALKYAEEIKSGSVTSNKIAGDNFEISSIGRRLFERLNIYRGILCGEVSSAVLLDDDLLSPECLSSRDSGTSEGIALIAREINDLKKASGEPVRVVLIGGRSGIAAAQLLEKLDPGSVAFTLIDSALSMVETAKMRLSSLPQEIVCLRSPEDQIADRLRYSFDVVLAINSFHRYRDASQGINLASLLIRRGGRLFALEHCELTPLGIVTAAVIDKGFADIDFERRRVFSPMLPGRQWANLLRKAGFCNVSFASLEDTFTELITADCPADRIELEPEDILKFARYHLPAHMIPERIEILPWLPLNANGKVDRGAIAAMFKLRTAAGEDEIPCEEMERKVAEMWKNLLDIESIGRNQGFFEIGGDSLLATRFLAAVKTEFGVEFSLRQLIEEPALFQVASILETKLAEMKQTMELVEEGEI